MQTIFRTFSFLVMSIAVISFGTMAFAEERIEFKDGTLIKGEIQNKTLTVKTSFGTLKPETEKISFISEGVVELKDGSKIMGDIVVEDEGLTVETKYGTWTLKFDPEDLQMITF